MTAEQVQEQHDQQSAKALQRQQSLKRFRVVGKVVQALNRFTAALNPTYNYGQAKEVCSDAFGLCMHNRG